MVPLASRKGLCVHEKLKNIDSVAQLNDKCEDLTEKGKCPHNDPDLTDVLATNLISSFCDIEELGKLANRM